MTRDDVGRALEHARRLQAQLNIFTQIEAEPSLSGEGLLAGVPVALKDLIDHEGRVTTSGSAFYRSNPSRSATIVTRLEDAGASIIGRTGLHEFAFGFSSENPHFGPVRNPWDPRTSPGGSSGGSAAAVAAGIVPIAIGTDTGGSVRVPAALCGCYGLKVTHGAIPIDGVFPLVPSIDTVGPIADSAENLHRAFQALSGDGSDLPPIDPVRFGVPQPWTAEAPLSPAVSKAFGEAVEGLKEMGHEVHQIQMPDVLPHQSLIFAIADEVADVHRDFRDAGEEYGEEVGKRLDDIFAISPSEIEEGVNWQLMIRDRFADAFATVDFILTPTVPVMRKVIGEPLIDGTHYRKVLSWFTAIVNHALLPAVALPLSGSGALPVSLQVIGPADSEPTLLGLARVLEVAGMVGFDVAPISGTWGGPGPLKEEYDKNDRVD